MDKISKILILKNSNLKICNRPKILTISSLNFQLPLDKLKIYRRSYYNLPNSVLWGWLSKIQNSGRILKRFHPRTQSRVLRYLKNFYVILEINFKDFKNKFQNASKHIQEILNTNLWFVWKGIDPKLHTFPGESVTAPLGGKTLIDTSE